MASDSGLDADVMPTDTGGGDVAVDVGETTLLSFEEFASRGRTGANKSSPGAVRGTGEKKGDDKARRGSAELGVAAPSVPSLSNKLAMRSLCE